jgi:hypothetical protein
MAPIAQPFSQDACKIGSCAFSALGWVESRFGIDFLVVIFFVVIVSIIVFHHLRRIFSPLCLSSPPASGNDDHDVIIVIVVVCLSSIPAGCHFSLWLRLVIIAS